MKQLRQIPNHYEPVKECFFTPWLQPGEQKKPKNKRL